MSYPYEEEDNTAEINVKMSLGQAKAVTMALDFYNRICLGQIEEVAEVIRHEILPRYTQSSGSYDNRVPASMDDVQRIEDLMKSAKATLGYPSNGSMGIGHQNMHISGLRSYEVCKVIDKALAVHRNPNPVMKGVNYDGLIVRYTKDPAPTAVITVNPPAAEPKSPMRNFSRM